MAKHALQMRTSENICDEEVAITDTNGDTLVDPVERSSDTKEDLPFKDEATTDAIDLVSVKHQHENDLGFTPQNGLVPLSGTTKLFCCSKRGCAQGKPVKLIYNYIISNY